MAYILFFLTALTAWAIFSTLGTTGSKSPIAIDHEKNITYHGFSSSKGVDSFLNIPFGQNTGGVGRFAPPKPFILSHNSIVNATMPGTVCPQSTGSTGGVNTNVTPNDISEDCLNLRVSRPAGTKSTAKLPVMAFIYGGGYSIGNIYDPLYTPDGLILSSAENGSPVIYVAMNYRIGVFGFAPSDTLRKRRSLNVGLRDQRLGLEWIQKNIEVFGGDPSRVTIFGQSAGANSVALQVTAFGGSQQFPFHQAIMESGTLTVESDNKRRENSNFRDLTDATHCTFIDSNSEETLDCLRSLPLETLLDAEIAVSTTDSLTESGLEVFIPLVDGDFLPEAPSKLFTQGRFAKVPMIAGWTEDDGTIFTPQNITTEEAIAFVKSGLFLPDTDVDTKALFSLYQPINSFQPAGAVSLPPAFYQMARIERDILFLCNALFMASKVTSQSNYHPTSHSRPSTLQTIFDKFSFQSKPDHAPEVFLYHLNQTALTPRLAAFGSPDLGVTHISDIPYVFNSVSNPSLLLNNTASNRLLASQMSKSWASFATFGRPSVEGKETLKGWLPALGNGRTRESDTRVLVIGGPNGGMSAVEGRGANDAVRTQRLAGRCAFITSAKVRGELFD